MVDLDGTFVPAHDQAIEVGEHLGYPLRMIHSAELGWCFEHVCDRQKGNPPTQGEIYIRCAPRIDKHDVQLVDGVISVHPSILCIGCSLHGYVVSSQWQGA